MHFDEISLQYWNLNKKKMGRSKSFSCIHNGYVYGDDMEFSRIEYIFSDSGKELIFSGKSNNTKSAYYELVEYSCNISAITLNNFINNPAEKFRIYTEQAVNSFTPQQHKSTRINDDSCKIIINDQIYYVANNLKICEYFNSAAMNINPSELDKWYIRIYFNDNCINNLKELDEIETVDMSVPQFTLTVTPVLSSNLQSKPHKNNSIVTINFQELNLAKKKIGDLGELLVLDYEYQRLMKSGHPELAAKIEHVSALKGDGYGYDILSYNTSGDPLYIEVKTTRQNKSADFYISKNEKNTYEQFHIAGKKYLIYRVYNLNLHTGKGNLTIYEPPFDNRHFVLECKNWIVKQK